MKNRAEKGSLEFQNKLPEFFKSNSNAYAKRIDEISDNLIYTKGGSITRGELDNIISNTINEVSETGVTQGQAFNYLTALKNKYRITDDFGVVNYNPNQTVDFKEAISDIRSIWKTVSPGVNYGKFTDTDLSASILKKNWGDFISKYVPELNDLNASYKPVILAMKESAKIFKPAQGELATKTSENFLKRLGKGKLSSGERKILSMVEQGTEFAPGVGEISQGIKDLGANRVATIAKQELNRASLQQGLVDKMSNLEQQNRQLTETINKNKEMLGTRLQSLGNRKEKVMQLMANRDKGRKIRNTLLIGSVLGAGATIPSSIQRIIYRVRTD